MRTTELKKLSRAEKIEEILEREFANSHSYIPLENRTDVIEAYNLYSSMSNHELNRIYNNLVAVESE